MESDKYTVQNLVDFAYQQKPVDFSVVFNDLLVDRLASAIDQKKIEVAQGLFANEPRDIDYEDSENGDYEDTDYESDSYDEDYD